MRERQRLPDVPERAPRILCPFPSTCTSAVLLAASQLLPYRAAQLQLQPRAMRRVWQAAAQAQRDGQKGWRPVAGRMLSGKKEEERGMKRGRTVWEGGSEMGREKRLREGYAMRGTR